MSFQNDIPLIQKIFDFYKDLCFVVEKMPKKDKFTLGERLQNLTLDCAGLFIEAGYKDKYQRAAVLEKAAIKLDLLKILTRLAQESKAISTRQYLSLEEKLQEIGRMLGGWLKSAKASG